MAQNITLMGASYSAVPAVTLPKTGGGTASFTDVTDTTAAAADVAACMKALLAEKDCIYLCSFVSFWIFNKHN